MSVLTLDSQNSGLIELGKVAVATGGQVCTSFTTSRRSPCHCLLISLATLWFYCKRLTFLGLLSPLIPAILRASRVEPASVLDWQVNKVDQSRLADEFSSIFADPVIATQVVAKLQVHHGLYVMTLSDCSSLLKHTLKRAKCAI